MIAPETSAKRLTSWIGPSLGPYLSTLIRVMSWKVVLALGLMIGLSLTEGLGLLILVLLLQLVGLDVQQGA
jgi:ATP-binding cassette subfamily C protein